MVFSGCSTASFLRLFDRMVFSGCSTAWFGAVALDRKFSPVAQPRVFSGCSSSTEVLQR